MFCNKFGQGDIAMLDGNRVKILACILDEDGSFWYEVEPIDFNPPARFRTREVPQEALKEI